MGSQRRDASGPDEELAEQSAVHLEIVVQRICRLVLNAYALAGRMQCVHDGDAREQSARAARLDRLRAAVELGQRALQATVWQHADRRSTPDRRRRPDPPPPSG